MGTLFIVRKIRTIGTINLSGIFINSNIVIEFHIHACAMLTENSESVIVLMAKMGLDKPDYHRAFPGIDQDRKLFPEDNRLFLDLIDNWQGLLLKSGN